MDIGLVEYLYPSYASIWYIQENKLYLINASSKIW